MMVTTFIRVKWMAVACLCLVSAAVPAQQNETTSCLLGLMEEYKVAGLAVAVVKKDRVVASYSFGKKDIESGEPLEEGDLFRIASISKSFSATSIMQLVEAKKISLDADMSSLVGFRVRNPKFPDIPITLRMALSHQSSINDSEGYFTLDAINPDKNPNWAKCYNDYAPGQGYQYCNLNYNMIGTIIEKFSGERFDQYVRRHILDPLGLYGGYCVDSLDKSRFATIYEYVPDSARFVASPNAYHPRSAEIAAYQMGYSTPIFSPTGGMKISASDLARYMIMHMQLGRYNGRRILSKKSAKRMQRPWSERDAYGFAITTTKKLIPGRTLKGHTGSAYGLYSAMFFEPKEKFGIVVITNGTNARDSAGYNALISRAVNCVYEKMIRK